MTAFSSIFLVVVTTFFIYEAIDARPFLSGMKDFDGGITSMVSSWLSQRAPGKAGNENEFRLPVKTGAQPVMPIGGNGMMNNGQFTGLGQQSFGQGSGRMLPNQGTGGMGQYNQFRGPQQPMALGAYKDQALNRAGRR